MVDSSSKRWQKIGGEETTLFNVVNIVIFNAKSFKEVSGTRDWHLVFFSYKKKMLCERLFFAGEGFFFLGKVVVYK